MRSTLRDALLSLAFEQSTQSKWQRNRRGLSVCSITHARGQSAEPCAEPSDYRTTLTSRRADYGRGGGEPAQTWHSGQMGYLRHWLLQFGGHQGDVSEEWSCGVRMAFPDGNGGVEDVDLPSEEDFLDNQAVPALTTWFQSPLAHIGEAAKLLTIKMNEIDAAGRYADQGTVHVRQLSVDGGFSMGLNAHPLQVAAVLSWRNNQVARGPGSHGRIYSPRPVVTVNAAGDVAGGDRVDICAQAVIMINTLDTTPGGLGAPAFRPCIVSKLGAGHVRQIDRVVVDSSLDIQRRRAKSQTREVTSQEVLY